jgi:hypothetical protein
MEMDDPVLEHSLELKAPENFTVPEYIDSRPYCLPPSSQGQTPSCAGYATAGWIEVQNWKEKHHAEQVDGWGIYGEAKKIDGNMKSGTSLSAAIQGAKVLGLIDANAGIRIVRTKRDVQFAMHQDDVVIIGFEITRGWNNCLAVSGWIGGEKYKIGGHAVLGSWYMDCGDKEDGFGWQNSWAPWGWQGFGRMSWEQFDDQFVYAATIERAI